MYKRTGLICLFLISFFTTVVAQPDSTSRLRVSLITCGAGDQIWETFGHTAVRIIDSNAGTDMVYNYGTFNGFDENFEINFMRGKLLYSLSDYPYKHFPGEYIEANRSVEEQVLLVDDSAKQQIKAFLEWNALEENRYYKYDFFFDNCATRIRDIFPKSLGNGFKFGQTIPADSRMTYREIMNLYFYRTHWERFGINILLGSRIDKVMSNTDIMFLPDYLRDGIAGATLNGQPIATKPELVVPGSPSKPAGINGPLLLTIGLSLLTILGLCIRPLKPLGNVMTFMMLFITGLLGCLVLVMWLGTDHQGCRDNFSLLWALPTNLIMAVARKDNKGKYAIVGMVLIVVALIFHILRIQQLPLLELGPILLALFCIYGTIYRKNKRNLA